MVERSNKRRAATVAVYRVQDRHGRGPWRPGVCEQWSDVGSERPDANIAALLEGVRGAKRSEHVGCACLSLGALRRWISAGEYRRLVDLGYRCVRLKGCRVLSDLGSEVVIARALPLSKGGVPVELYEARMSPLQGSEHVGGETQGSRPGLSAVAPLGLDGGAG